MESVSFSSIGYSLAINRHYGVRAVGLLGGIFTYAIEHGIIEKNPVHGVRKAADKVKDRRLNDIKEGASVRPVGLAAIDLLDSLRPEKPEGLVFAGTIEGTAFSGFLKSGS